MKINKIFSLINIIWGILLALTPFIIFPVCSELKDNGTYMNCFYSGTFITIMGILIIIFSVINFYGKYSYLSLLNYIISLLCGVMCYLVPNKIIEISGEGWACSLCGNPEHACRAATMPVIYVIVILVIIVNVTGLIINFVKE